MTEYRTALLDWLACALGGRTQRASRAARVAGYLVAYVILRGEPEPASFDGVDPDVQSLARERVRVATDPALRKAEAVLALGDDEVARVPASRGSPELPLGEAELAAKCERLAGDRLDGLLDDPDAPAQRLLAAFAKA